MNDQWTMGREDRDAIFAALRGIEGSLRHLGVKGLDNEAALYAISNNVNLIRLRLNAQAELATQN